jgi:putative inorganic carbon (hco3(-)) transporter
MQPIWYNALPYSCFRMTFTRDDSFRAAQWAAFASSVSILLSIAASQILLGIAIALLLYARTKLRLPRCWLPLAFFLLGTMISLAFSSDPRHGMPQVRKMYVYTMLIVVFTTIRETRMARRLVLAWGAVGAAVATLGIIQFIGDVQAANAQHQDFYQFYLPHRITGAMSHWMTFAGEEMQVLLMLMAFVLFAPGGKRFWIWIVCLILLATAELLNETRTVWLALAVSGFGLAWYWKPKAAMISTVVIVSALWFAPGSVHDRFISIFKPKKDVDSNEFRYITRRAGWEMVKAHPLLGLGPEEVHAQMPDWIPKDLERPLPPGYYGHLHNFYLQYAAERGIPTTLMLVWMLLMILYDFGRGLSRLPPGRSDARFVLLGGIASVVAVMVSGLFEHNLGDSEVLTMFLTMVAIGYTALETRKPEKVAAFPVVT